MSIYQNTQSISGCTWISGTRVRQTRGKWHRHRDIDTIIPRAEAVVMINVGLAPIKCTLELSHIAASEIILWLSILVDSYDYMFVVDCAISLVPKLFCKANYAT